MPKMFMIDTSRCTACRGCQIACKEWNDLPANKTYQYGWGSHQNPQDLNPNNYKLLRFSEHLEDGVVRWNFFPDQCRHCDIAPCKETGDMYIEEAITKDENTGAVIFTDKTKGFTTEQFEEIKDSCPYDVPRRNEATKVLAKCTMCNERVVNGMLPACVKSCPTGTMNFGNREDMLKLAKEHLAFVKKKFPKATIANAGDVNVIYILTDAPEKYWKYAEAPVMDRGISRKKFLAKVGRPITKLTKNV